MVVVLSNLVFKSGMDWIELNCLQFYFILFLMFSDLYLYILLWE